MYETMSPMRREGSSWNESFWELKADLPAGRQSTPHFFESKELVVNTLPRNYRVAGLNNAT